MASFHLARRTTDADGSRIVAVKRLHREHTFDKDSVAILSEEARLWGRVRHANVLGMIDLAIIDGALGLVVEHVAGEMLAVLVERSAARHEPIPPSVAVAIVRGVLCGIQAAHEARGEDGAPAPIAHGDISPPKILVGADGKARIVDFSTAKSRDAVDGAVPELRGSTAYMPPEQVLGSPMTEKGDVYAAGVVLWELLAGRSLFACGDEAQTSAAVLAGATAPPSAYNTAVPPELDAVVMRAIAPRAYGRYATAGEFAAVLEPWCTADERAVGAWVNALAAEQLVAVQHFLDRVGASHDERSVESNASIPGVERPTDGHGGKEGLFERAIRTLFAYTPFAPPADLRRFQMSLLAGGLVVVLACVFVGMTKGEPEATTEPGMEEPTLAAPATAPEPEPVMAEPAAPVAPVASAVPVAPEPAAPEPTAPAPRVTPVRATRPAAKSAPPSNTTAASNADSSPTVAPRPIRRSTAPTSTTTPAPTTPTSDDPGALKDYR